MTVEADEIAGLRAEIAALRAAGNADRHLRAMADAVPILIWETDATGLTFVNQHYLDFFGVSFSEVREMGWSAFLHPDDRDEYVAAYTEASTSRQPYAYECRFRRADGVYRWLRNTGTPVGADRLAGGSVDITDVLELQSALKESEEALRRSQKMEAEEKLTLSQAQLRLATDVGEIGEWDVDQLTGTMFWPPRVKAMFGISPEVPVTLDDYYNGVHPDDREKTLACYASASDPTLRALYEVDYRTIGREDGVIRWVAARGRGLFNADGACYRVIGTAIDITERKTNEIRLRELNEQLEQEVTARTAERNRVWEMSQELLAIMDLDGCLKAINPAWSATLGQDTERLLLLPLHEQIHADDRPGMNAAMAELRNGETVERFEGRLSRADGSWRWISWTLVAEAGTSYAVGRDVTSEKEAAGELEQAQEALRQSQKMEAVGQLTGGLAHDFNNLLTGVTGSLELLQTRIAQGRIKDWTATSTPPRARPSGRQR